MRQLIDCHLHTAACGHGIGSVAQMVGAATAAGLRGLMFTEHLPLPDALNESGEFAPNTEDFDRYAEEVRESIATSSTQIVLGAEADWLPHRPEAMERQAEVAKAAGVRVVLGSVHFIEDWPFDSPSHLDGWERRGADRVWREYFGLWCDAARSGRFDVMAHPDLVKKFGYRPSFDPAELYLEAAEAARDGRVMIEVSTAGLRRPAQELYPAPDLLAQFNRQGVSATVGSDAHAPSEVGDRIELAYAALGSAGYDRVGFPIGGGEVRWIEL